LKMSKILHEPQLDTILMVERAIKDSDDYPTKTELWRSLPKRCNTRHSAGYSNI